MDREPEPTDAAGGGVMFEDGPGCEMIDGVWVPKHPPDEYEEETDREGCELIDGEWVEKPMSNKSGVIGTNLNRRLIPWLDASRFGFVCQNETVYRLFPTEHPRTQRKPDLSVVRRERFPDDRVPDGPFDFPPDVAVEVISPNDRANDVEKKLDEYLRSGTRLVWVVYIPTRNVWAYRPDGTARLFRSADTLTADGVLPGFAAPVAELFDGV